MTQILAVCLLSNTENFRTPEGSIQSFETQDSQDRLSQDSQEELYFEGKLVVNDYKKFKRSKTFKTMKAIHGMNLRNFLYIKGKEQEDSASPSSEEDLIHIHSPVSAPSATTPWSEICNLSNLFS